MGHPQPHTPMKVDNETAIGFLKITMKQKRSKAIDMRFYGVRDRVNKNQLIIYLRPGSNTVGDYVSKHHSPAKLSINAPKNVCVPHSSKSPLYVYRKMSTETIFMSAARV